MTNISPTAASVRWGPEKWQLFDYYANPVRDTGGNPCFIYRHGGGGFLGNFSNSSASGVKDGDYAWELIYYLLTANVDTHFDVVSIQTSQQTVFGTNAIRRTIRSNMLNNVWDHKRGVCAVKAWGVGMGNTTSNRIDPTKIVTGGHSFGGTVTALSMITPPIVNATNWSVGARRIYEPQQFDSSPLGVFYFSSQVDFRNRSLANAGVVQTLDYLLYSTVEGIFGTQNGDGGTEWNAVPAAFKEACSLLAYIENGYTQYYKPMYILYQDNGSTFTGVYPLPDNHDKKMRLDLIEALKKRNLPYQTDLFNANLGTWPTPPGGFDALSAPAIYGWMSRLVKQIPSNTLLASGV